METPGGGGGGGGGGHGSHSARNLSRSNSKTNMNYGSRGSLHNPRWLDNEGPPVDDDVIDGI